MRFDAQETPTFRGGASGVHGPVIAEAMVLYDREDNIIGSFQKDGGGNVTLELNGTIIGTEQAAISGTVSGSINVSGQPDAAAPSAASATARTFLTVTKGITITTD